jgi:hypothetical protein
MTIGVACPPRSAEEGLRGPTAPLFVEALRERYFQGEQP